MTFALIIAEAAQGVTEHPGFVPVHKYDTLLPIKDEIGCIRDVRFVVVDGQEVQFVDSHTFAAILRNDPHAVRESPIRARVFGVTYISLVPPELT